jgi:uncharacterized Zn-binding protein involved in type VI secretion
MINGLPAARVDDRTRCVGQLDAIAEGSPTVFINGKPAARVGDRTSHGGVIIDGSPNVVIGDVGNGGLGTSFAVSQMLARDVAGAFT